MRQERLSAEKEAQIAEGLAEGLAHREIAGRVGCAQSTVGRVGVRLGIYRMRRRVPRRVLDGAVARYEQGQKVYLITRVMGIWPTTLYRELRRRGVPLRIRAVKREEQDEQR